MYTRRQFLCTSLCLSACALGRSAWAGFIRPQRPRDGTALLAIGLFGAGRRECSLIREWGLVARHEPVVLGAVYDPDPGRCSAACALARELLADHPRPCRTVAEFLALPLDAVVGAETLAADAQIRRRLRHASLPLLLTHSPPATAVLVPAGWDLGVQSPPPVPAGPRHRLREVFGALGEVSGKLAGTAREL